jgi:hypothetical protein
MTSFLVGVSMSVAGRGSQDLHRKIVRKIACRCRSITVVWCPRGRRNMGIAVIVLGLLGLIGSWYIYFTVHPGRDLYVYGLLGYVLSWVVMVMGVWMVVA